MGPDFDEHIPMTFTAFAPQSLKCPSRMGFALVLDGELSY
jgi:hypothetical protein